MFIVVLVTAKDMDEAHEIAKQLTENQLIACANIVKGVKSIFHWGGKVEEAEEVLMVMKTREECFSKIIKMVKSLHSYDAPEIIALPIIDGSADYLKWIEDSVID